MRHFCQSWRGRSRSGLTATGRTRARRRCSAARTWSVPRRESAEWAPDAHAAACTHLTSPWSPRGLLRGDHDDTVHTVRAVLRHLVRVLQHFDLYDVFRLEPVDATVRQDSHGRSIDHIERLATTNYPALNPDRETCVFCRNDVGPGKAANPSSVDRSRALARRVDHPRLSSSRRYPVAGA